MSGISSTGGILEQSIDAGRHWGIHRVPGTSQVSAPYIAAVADNNTVYVRLSGTPGQLLVTRDGGLHFKTVLTFQGSLDGFALSPDGKLALASGPADGVWRAPTASLVFEQLSCAKLRCLSWSAAGLFACADEFEASFLVGEPRVVGEPRDSGQSFAPRLHLPCVRGPLACASGSLVGAVCPAAWPAISEQLGSDCANAGSFMPSTACTSESNGGTGNESAGATAGAGLESTAARTDVRPRGGCSLSAEPGSRGGWLWGLAPLFVLIRRRAAGARELARRRC